MKFKIGDKVKVKGLKTCGRITHIKHGDKNDPYDMDRYKVRESNGLTKHWSAKSLRKVRSCK